MARRGPRRSLHGTLAFALALAPAAVRAAPADAGSLTAEGQARRDAGDTAGAIDRWQQALAALPATQATAHRRAGLVLAIAAAHDVRFARTGAARELEAALLTIDGYLAGLDPTDDENRVAVEQRRAEVAAKLARARAPTSTSTRPGDAVDPPADDRRLRVAGGTVLGLGVLGLGVLATGLGLGVRADRALTAAVALPGDDPGREAAKAAALTEGGRANDAALAGGVIGGVLVVTGAALLVAAAVKQSRARRVRAAGAGLVIAF
ncbi:MAG: hypothetical protein JNL82_35410 [Myxococcales bacterium]|nr:hypothetical protein [Myxococcales bacterium]